MLHHSVALGDILIRIFFFFVSVHIIFLTYCQASALAQVSPPQDLRWRICRLRALRLKLAGDPDQEFRDIPLTDGRTQSLMSTGRLARMRNVSNVFLTLNGLCTEQRMELLGYEYVRAMPSGAAASGLAGGEGGRTSRQASPERAPTTDASADAATDGVTATEDSAALATSTSMATATATPVTSVTSVGEALGEEQRQLRREMLSLTKVAGPGLTQKWVGTYRITHEVVSARPTDSIERDIMKNLTEASLAAEQANDQPTGDTAGDEQPAAAVEGKSESKNEDILTKMINLMSDFASQQPKIVLDMKHDIELEFTPFINYIEEPGEYSALFGVDLHRFHELLGHRNDAAEVLLLEHAFIVFKRADIFLKKKHFFSLFTRLQAEDDRAYHQDGDDEVAPLPPATTAPLADPQQALADAEHTDVVASASAITPMAAPTPAAAVQIEESPQAAAEGASLSSLSSSASSTAGLEGSTAGSWVVLPAGATKMDPVADPEAALAPASDDAAHGQ
jgi:hypothetical protein